MCNKPNSSLGLDVSIILIWYLQLVDSCLKYNPSNRPGLPMIRHRLATLSDVEFLKGGLAMGSTVRKLLSRRKVSRKNKCFYPSQSFFESYSHALEDLMEKAEMELEDEKENSDSILES